MTVSAPSCHGFKKGRSSARGGGRAAAKTRGLLPGEVEPKTCPHRTPPCVWGGSGSYFDGSRPARSHFVKLIFKKKRGPRATPSSGLCAPGSSPALGPVGCLEVTVLLASRPEPCASRPQPAPHFQSRQISGTHGRPEEIVGGFLLGGRPAGGSPASSAVGLAGRGKLNIQGPLPPRSRSPQAPVCPSTPGSAGAPPQEVQASSSGSDHQEAAVVPPARPPLLGGCTHPALPFSFRGRAPTSARLRGQTAPCFPYVPGSGRRSRPGEKPASKAGSGSSRARVCTRVCVCTLCVRACGSRAFWTNTRPTPEPRGRWLAGPGRVGRGQRRGLRSLQGLGCDRL